MRVECHAGYRGAEEPRRLVFEDRRTVEVVAVLARWQSPGERGFRLTGDDQTTYVAVHHETADTWTVTAQPRGRPTDKPGGR